MIGTADKELKRWNANILADVGLINGSLSSLLWLVDGSATIFNGNSEFDLDVDQIWTKNALLDRRQVYFSMVTALRKGHFRREWLQDCWTCASTSCTNLQGRTQQIVGILRNIFSTSGALFLKFSQCVGEDSKTFKRPLLLPLDLDSARSDVDAAWYMALVGVPRGQKAKSLFTDPEAFCTAEPAAPSIEATLTPWQLLLKIPTTITMWLIPTT